MMRHRRTENSAEPKAVSNARVIVPTSEQAIASRRREGLRLGGVTLVTADAGLLLLLKPLNAPFRPEAFRCSSGAAILLYAYVLEPRGSR